MDHFWASQRISYKNVFELPQKIKNSHFTSTNILALIKIGDPLSVKIEFNQLLILVFDNCATVLARDQLSVVVSCRLSEYLLDGRGDREKLVDVEAISLGLDFCSSSYSHFGRHTSRSDWQNFSILIQPIKEDKL